MKYLSLTVVCVLASVGCRSGQETTEQASGFEVKEDFEEFMNAPPDPVDVHRPKPPPEVVPVYEDDYRVEYAPDVLPWAKPGYKVIFHKQEEVSTYSESHPGWPDRARIHESYPFIEEDNIGAIRSIQLSSWASFASKGGQFEPTMPSSLQEPLDQDTHQYSGIYLPTFLDVGGEDALHLFECSKLKFPYSRHLYVQPGYWFSCEYHRQQHIHIPDDSPLAKPFDCVTKRAVLEDGYINHSGTESFLDTCENEELSAAADLNEPMELVTWLGDAPPNVNADQHGYEFVVYPSRTIGPVRYTDGCMYVEDRSSEAWQKCQEPDNIAPQISYILHEPEE